MLTTVSLVTGGGSAASQSYPRRGKSAGELHRRRLVDNNYDCFSSSLWHRRCLVLHRRFRSPRELLARWLRGCGALPSGRARRVGHDDIFLFRSIARQIKRIHIAVCRYTQYKMLNSNHVPAGAGSRFKGTVELQSRAASSEALLTGLQAAAKKERSYEAQTDGG